MATATDRLGEGVGQVRVQLVGGPLQRLSGNPEVGGGHAVEPLRELAQRVFAAVDDGIDDGRDDGDGGLHVELAPGKVVSVGAVDACQI